MLTEETSHWDAKTFVQVKVSIDILVRVKKILKRQGKY